MHTSTLLGVLSLVILSVAQEQAPFDANQNSNPGVKASKKRALTGRFLHVTDFHPDTHYKAGATFESGCHRRPKKDKKGKGKARADVMDKENAVDEESFDYEQSLGGKERSKDDLSGKWGSAVSDCDSPISLVNATFDWIKTNLANEIDFVIWTGDNARHDIDRSIPRTPREIFNLNKFMIDKMIETFPGDVPIVPSLGNNDIYPHNVMAAGPNTVTSSLLRIWGDLIPPDDRHVFERGAYFSVEVIPDRLAVISLNTLFWYDSNTLVDGCKDRSNDPGALQMDWLEVQLQEFRDRAMQVWLTGHVPPHLGNYYENCYLRYGDLSLRFQDTIVGHLYGHMNIDHFFFVEVDELEAASPSTKANLNSPIPFSPSPCSNSTDVNEITFGPPPLRHGPPLKHSSRFQIMGRNGNRQLVDALKKDFGEMPGPEIMRLKDYVVINVSPSVIPTYLPAVRVFSYNITGVSRNPEENKPDLGYIPGLPGLLEGEYDDLQDNDEDYDITQEEEEGVFFEEVKGADDDDDDFKRKHGHRHGGKKKKKHPKKDCEKPENEDKPHCTFRRKPRFQSRDSPSRRNRPLSALGYAQWFIPNLDSVGEEPPKFELEYTTYKLKDLIPGNWTGNGSDSNSDSGGWNQPPPVPLRLIPGYEPSFFIEGGGDLDQGQEWGSFAARMEDADGGVGECDDLACRRKSFIQSLKKKTPWKMKDLTIPSYVKLARKLVAEKKMWKQFSEFMFVSSGAK